VDCEGDLGWVPASFIKPVYGDNDENGERFPAGKGNNLPYNLMQKCKRARK